MAKINLKGIKSLGESLGDTLGDVLNQTKEMAKSAVDSTGEVIENINTKVSDWKEQKERDAQIASGLYQEDGKTVISTIDGYQKWLTDLPISTAESYLELFNSQRQILSVVNSPILVGMALDNVINSLNKALSTAHTDHDKTIIRDMYASMIQNLFFFMEAKIHYAIDKNKDFAYQMIGQVGDTLSTYAIKLMKIATSEEELRGIEIRKFFSTMPDQIDFFKKTTSWAKDKKEIIKKMDEYRTTIENMFHMFDIYSDLIGQSITIHGLLSKYRRFLVDTYKEERFAPVRKRYKNAVAGRGLKAIGSSLEFKEYELSNPVSFGLRRVSKVLQGVGDVVSQVEDPTESIDIFFSQQNMLRNQKAEKEKNVQSLLNEVSDLKSQYDALGMLQLGMKKEISSSIDKKNKELKEAKSKLSEIESNLSDLDNSFPEAASIKFDIEQYETKLKKIEEKFIPV